jgi:hypothetical protein
MTIRVLALLATAGSCLWADEFGRGEQNTVTICLERNGAGNLSYASSLVSRMYAAIDVQINWRPARNCPASAIRVKLEMFTLPHKMPGALAYALPYERTRIVVFYDRVLETEPRRIPALTAHVIAHEIGHILEGVCRHSSSGVMKAEWDEDDLSKMAWKPLPFAPEDVFIIHQGLQDRTTAVVQRH